MSLYRSMGRGSWIVERTLLGLHIRRATGAADYHEAAEIEVVLLRLAKHGRRDLLAAFDAGQITGQELRAGVEQYGITLQLTADRAVALAPAVERWLATADLADKTKEDYGGAFVILQRRHRRAVVADLPALLATYAQRAKPVMFVHVKAAVQSFIRATVRLGGHSDLWREVSAIQGRKAKRRKVQGGLTPGLSRTVAEALSRRYGATYGALWWTLYCTGMGKRECWVTPWKVLADRIAVHGTKRAGRDRIVPRLTTPVRPTMPARRFNEALAVVGAELGIPRLTIYVARRSFAHLLELAKLPDSQCDALMGHGPKGDRGKYREHDVAPYLASITTALRAVLGADPQYVRALA